MGRRKKIPAPPPNFKQHLKDATNWETLIKTLQQLAIGGHEMQNYNGQTITATPNIEALKLLLQYGWGRPTEENPADNSEERIAMGKTLAAIIKDDMKTRGKAAQTNETEK